MNYSGISFGEVLKSFRKRQKLTQKDLAQRLDLHYNTISGWERGNNLPESKTLVLELARHLRLDTQDTHQLLEASLTALASYWNVPYQRNPFFTGRTDFLRTLHTLLHPAEPSTLTRSYVLSGIGGIGKTQTALEYAYRHASDYTAIFWIGAASYETLVTSFLSIAHALQLSEQESQDHHRLISLVLRWLNTHRDWLLIVDNVEDVELVKSFLPAHRQGSLLLTSRLQALGTVSQHIEIEPLGEEESVHFFLHRARILIPPFSLEQVSFLELHHAQTLVTSLGGLPLAIDQAAAYIDETHCSLSDFLDLYTSETKYLLDQRETYAEHPESIFKTFTLAFTKVQQRNPAAVELLIFCCFLAPDAIPEDYLLESLAFCDVPLSSLKTQPLLFQGTLKDLLAFSLLSRNAQTKTMTIHRLVQTVMRTQMEKEQQQLWIERTLKATNSFFPIADEVPVERWKHCEQLLPHALTVLKNLEQALPQDTETGRIYIQLLSKTAKYVFEHAQFQKAEKLYLAVLRLQEHFLGSHAIERNIAFNNLGNIYREQGQYEKARHFFLLALEVAEQASPPVPLDVARVLSNLAIVDAQLGDYERAEIRLLHSVQLAEQALGPDQPDVGRPLANLAIIYKDWGQYEKAMTLAQRTLTLWQRHLGLHHPLLAHIYELMAECLLRQEKNDTARQLYEQAQHIVEQALGAEHPRMTSIVAGLAALQNKDGHYAEAESLYQRALVIQEQALGIEHPESVALLKGLATLNVDTQRYGEAEHLYRQALAIQERYLGFQHPQIVTTITDVAELYQMQHRYSEAQDLYDRALRMQAQFFGVLHPSTQQLQQKYQVLRVVQEDR